MSENRTAHKTLLTGAGMLGGEEISFELTKLGMEEYIAVQIQETVKHRATKSDVDKLQLDLIQEQGARVAANEVLRQHYNEILKQETNSRIILQQKVEAMDAELKEIRKIAEEIKPDYHQTQKEMAELRGRLNTTLYFFGAILLAVMGAVIAGASGVLESLGKTS